MATLKEQIERLKRKNPKNALSQSLNELEDELIGYNVAQLSDGRNNLGNLIGRYSPATQKYYVDPQNPPQRSKYAGDPYNFQWTGSFLEHMRANVVGTTVELTSDVSYVKLIQQLGSRNRAQGKLFGLSKKHLKEFNDKHLLPKMRGIIKSQ